MNKKGALELSFGMIFSIILIIVFIAAGFYGITKFLDFQKTVQIQTFMSDFQTQVNQLWQSPKGTVPLSYSLPTNIDAVCFKNDNVWNLQFNSTNIIKGTMISNIDIAKTTANGPLCIKNIDGKVNITITKNFGESLVTVEG